MITNEPFNLFKVSCKHFKVENNEGTTEEICGMQGKNCLCLCSKDRCTRLRDLPKIICLCGSTRFTKAYDDANLIETMKDNIVLSIGVRKTHLPEDEEQRKAIEDKLDELHKRKIDLADEVFILNVDGYVGESTKSEIEYAVRNNKIVRYLEKLK